MTIPRFYVRRLNPNLFYVLDNGENTIGAELPVKNGQFTTYDLARAFADELNKKYMHPELYKLL